MDGEARTVKSTKNLIINIFTQIGILLINFIARTIFINILGVEYLGISGLFKNILTVLSLSELGFGSAIIYSMYKPLAENDHKKLAALMNFYKKIYHRIALIVLIIGLAILPLLPAIINFDNVNTIGMNEIRIYYLLFLINSLSSYLFAYKSNIISADQKLYLVNLYSFVTVLVQFILQTTFLILTHNYIVYLIIMVCCTFANNIYISYKAKKLYPYIENDEKLDKSERTKIYNNVKSIFIYKVATVLVENIDIILISILVSTVAVGLFSNYSMISKALLAITTLVFASLTASIGNLNTEKNNTKKEEVFRDITFISIVLLGIFSACLITCLNDFICLWIGKQYILSDNIMLAIVFNFYIYGTLNPVCVYRDTTGIFREAKNIALVLLILNLILSIILGLKLGMFGILLATGISKLLTNYWYQPYILYRDIFKTSPKKYFINLFLNIVLIIIICLVLKPIMALITINGITGIIIKGLITAIISFMLIIIFNIPNPSIKRLINRFKTLKKL